MATHHIAVTILHCARQTNEQLQQLFPDYDDVATIRKELAQLQAEGLEFVPSCDNVDSRGRCLGHE